MNLLAGIRGTTPRSFRSTETRMEKRFQSPRARPTTIRRGSLTVREGNRTTSIGNRPVHLTPTEFDLALLFAKNVGCVLTHRFILSSVDGLALKNGALESDRVRAAVDSLQRKLSPEGRALFVTVPGAGYLFAPQEDEISGISQR